MLGLSCGLPSVEVPRERTRGLPLRGTQFVHVLQRFYMWGHWLSPFATVQRSGGCGVSARPRAHVELRAGPGRRDRSGRRARPAVRGARRLDPIEANSATHLLYAVSSPG
jgi:hypothetical protein